MKLESLKLEKFQDSALKKEQMFMLNGGGSKTEGAGTNLHHVSGGKMYLVDYAYDIDGRNVPGGLTFHGYSNWRVQSLQMHVSDLFDELEIMEIMVE